MLKKLIDESFFNPLLHVFPLFVFLVAEDYLGLSWAWGISSVFTLSFLLYTKYLYPSLFFWQVYSALMWSFIGMSITLTYFILFPPEYRWIVGEFIAAFYLMISLLFKRRMERFISEQAKGKMSMQNNLYEFERLIISMAILLFIYVDVYVGLASLELRNEKYLLGFVTELYLVFMFLLFLYEFIRVKVVRAHLLKEEWWPILNESGKPIGSIQQFASLNDSVKYKHPVVRLYMMEQNKLFLHENTNLSMFNPSLWDSPVFGHIRVGETPEDALHRLTIGHCDYSDLNPVYLMHYLYEAEQEIQFVHLFIANCPISYKTNSKEVKRSKWWTVTQIEDNIDSGIFSDQFKQELLILKRSGLISGLGCNCECILKDTFS